MCTSVSTHPTHFLLGQRSLRTTNPASTGFDVGAMFKPIDTSASSRVHTVDRYIGLLVSLNKHCTHHNKLTPHLDWRAPPPLLPCTTTTTRFRDGAGLITLGHRWGARSALNKQELCTAVGCGVRCDSLSLWLEMLSCAREW